MTDREIISAHAAARLRSWEDSTDDASRLVLERACDAISELKRRLKDRDARLVRQAAEIERAELTLERAADVIPALRSRLKERDERLARQAALLERAEHLAEVMHRAAFGSQKGGAA